MAFKSLWIAGAAVVTLFTGSERLNAQFDVVSTIRMSGPTDSTLLISGAEAQEDLNIERTKAVNSVLLERRDYPTDSIEAVIRARAQAWMTRLVPGHVQGFEQDAHMQVALSAHDDARAVQIIDARLATPQLPADERAYALMLAAEGFADPKNPARLPVAERYLAQLKEMGTRGWAPTRRTAAELSLFDAYNALGRSSDAARHGEAALRLLPHIPMREVLFTIFYASGGVSYYSRIVSTIAVQPGGRAKIKELNALLLAGTVPAADSVALDSGYARIGAELATAWKSQIRSVERIGDVAAPITSNFWINVADSSPHAIRVDDGKIRIIESGNRGCEPCLYAMSGLQHLQDAFPDIQAVLVTFAQGSWANRTLTPREEAPFDKDFFVNQKKLQYPIALWLPTKTDTVADGIYPYLGDDSALVHYPESQPLITILDGHGRIRFVADSYLRGDEFKYYANVIRHLEAEAAVDSTQAATRGATGAGH